MSIIKDFHQFISIEKGPINTAIIDFLKGNVYQVKNEIIDKFMKRKYQEIPEFIQSLKAEELIIEVDERRWIPRINLKSRERDEDENSLELEVENGTDLMLINNKFMGNKISKIVFYGKKNSAEIIPEVKTIYRRKQFKKCLEKSTIDGLFGKVDETIYKFNMIYNSCWGRKIAVTADNKIRPCIYSELVIGDIKKDEIEGIIDKAKEYWSITKDKIEKCKDCEFRYMCFDCREIAYREKKDLFGSSPYCSYDSHSGKWQICKL